MSLETETTHAINRPQERPPKRLDTRAVPDGPFLLPVERLVSDSQGFQELRRGDKYGTERSQPAPELFAGKDSELNPKDHTDPNAMETFEKLLETAERWFQKGNFHTMEPWKRRVLGLATFDAGLVLLFLNPTPIPVSIPLMLLGVLLFEGSMENALKNQPEVFYILRKIHDFFVWTFTKSWLGRNIFVPFGKHVVQPVNKWVLKPIGRAILGTLRFLRIIKKPLPTYPQHERKGNGLDGTQNGPIVPQG